jgi:hypothetical protein
LSDQGARWFCSLSKPITPLLLGIDAASGDAVCLFAGFINGRTTYDYEHNHSSDRSGWPRTVI